MTDCPSINERDIWIKGGLISPQHVRQMGMARWLYDYLIQRQEYQTGAVEVYNHEDAARQLGQHTRTIQRWFRTLLKWGYIIVSRGQRALTVEITKHIPLSQRVRGKRTVQRTVQRTVDPEPIDIDTEVTSEPSQSESRYDRSVAQIRQNWPLSSTTLDQQINNGQEPAPAPPKRTGHTTPQAALVEAHLTVRSYGLDGLSEPIKKALFRTANLLLSEGFTPKEVEEETKANLDWFTRKRVNPIQSLNIVRSNLLSNRAKVRPTERPYRVAGQITPDLLERYRARAQSVAVPTHPTPLSTGGLHG